MQDILNIIYQELGTFSPSQQKIARIILENPTKVAQMNLEEFADVLQVTQSKITEFCEKLGLSSFIQLREKLGNMALENETTSSKILKSLPTFEKENLLSILKDTSLVQVVAADLTVQNKIIELFNKNGIFSIGAANREVSLAQTMHLHPGDVLLVLEPKEPSFALIKQVQIAKHQSVKIITLGEELGRRVGIESDCFIELKEEQALSFLDALITKVIESNLKLQKFKKQYQTILKSKLS